MKKNKLLVIISIFVLLLTSFTIQSCNKSQKEIEIGAILPSTGAAAQYGEDVRKGAELAVEEINANGGIKGTPVKIVYEDSASDPKTALLAFEKMMATSNVSAILSEVSGVVLALAPKANEKKVILFNVGAQNPKIKESGPYILSNINDASVESKLLADFAYNRLKARRAAVLYANAAYGEGARSVFSDTFHKIGGEMVAEVQFPENGADYRAQIRALQDAPPEVVYLPGLTKDIGKILKQSYELGFKPQWLSYASFEGEDVIKIAGVGAEGVIYTSMSLSYEKASPIAKKFIDKFEGKYSQKPRIYCATGYDAIILLSKAIGEVGNDASKIREYLFSMPAFEGASGVNKFLSNGSVEKPMVFKTVKDGKFVLYD